MMSSSTVRTCSFLSLPSLLQLGLALVCLPLAVSARPAPVAKTGTASVGPGVVPIITSPTSHIATIGLPVEYAITATSSPTRFAATGLPEGIVCDAATGRFSGVATAFGTYEVQLSVGNKSAGSTATLTFVVNGSQGPIEYWLMNVLPPAEGTYRAGESMLFRVVYNDRSFVSGEPRLALVVGTETRYATYVSGTGSPTLHFAYTPQAGDNDHDGLVLAPRIDLNGGAIVDSAGNAASGPSVLPVTFVPQAKVSGDLPALATSAPAAEEPATIHSAVAATTSPAAPVVIALRAGASPEIISAAFDAPTSVTTVTEPLQSLSTRGLVGMGEGALVVGFIVPGTEPQRVLVRGLGPRLAALGVATAVADPVLRLYRGNVLIAENDNWTANDAAAMAAVGALPLEAGSEDAAIVLTLAPGAYSAIISGKRNMPDVGLVEVYSLSGRD